MNAHYAGDRTTGFASPASNAVEGPIDLSQTLNLGLGLILLDRR